MEIIKELITNDIVIACFTALLISQTIKTLITLIKEKRLDIKQFLIGTGGMPSSHTAVVCALTTTILLKEGITTLFVVVLIFTIVIIRDTIGVRRESGKHAVLLNKMIGFFYKRKIKTTLNELSGHSPLQALVGIIIGIVAVLLVM